MKILITGNGLVAKTLVRKINSYDNCTAVTVDRSNYNLLEDSKVKDCLNFHKPDYVVHTASKVGGIGAHINSNSLFLYENCLINLNVVENCFRFKIPMIALSSVSAFSDKDTYLKEENVNQGEVHNSEYGYSLSKRLLDNQIQIYIKEHQCNFSCIFPVNIYGPEDNFNLNSGHCIASIMHRLYLAKRDNTDLLIWGDGKSLRQFIFVDDLADIIYHIITSNLFVDRLLTAHPCLYSIKEVVDLMVNISNFKNNIVFDTTKPNGIRARECNLDRLKSIKIPKTNLKEGLEITWSWLEENYDKARK